MDRNFTYPGRDSYSSKMKVSIILPVYNEEKTIQKVINKIKKTDFKIDKEIIVVNDGSRDKTIEILNNFKSKKGFVVINKIKNEGKGSAIISGIKIATGDIIAIHDADLEYETRDLKLLIKPILEGKSTVVYGSRFLKENSKYKVNSFYVANRVLSFFTSLLYLKKITDMETCYKVFDAKTLKALRLKDRKSVV